MPLQVPPALGPASLHSASSGMPLSSIHPGGPAQRRARIRLLMMQPEASSPAQQASAQPGQSPGAAGRPAPAAGTILAGATSRSATSQALSSVERWLRHILLFSPLQDGAGNPSATPAAGSTHNGTSTSHLSARPLAMSTLPLTRVTGGPARVLQVQAGHFGWATVTPECQAQPGVVVSLQHQHVQQCTLLALTFLSQDALP